MKTYTTYEAKARFSEVLRLVRERGESVIVTYHGEPVAEIRPIAAAPEEGFEAHLRRLEERGVVVRERKRIGGPREVARKPGALDRFLADRD